MLVRKECFQKVGLYDTTVRYGPDWEMSIRLARCFEFEVIPEPLYNYSFHADQLTGNLQCQIDGLQRILEIHSDLFAGRFKAHSHLLVNLALLYYRSGNRSQARLFLKQGIRRRPFWFRPYKLFLLSYLSEQSFRKLLALRERVFI